jgi:translation initiation factor IF-3
MENVNDGIRIAKVRAIFPDGSAEVMPTAVAVHRAQAMGLDLVLIAPTAMPPVAKAIDYRQWLHENGEKHLGDN